MGLRDLLHETWFSLTANKARSFLTTLGIIIGIASVIAMTSLIGGMQNMFMGELGASQARVIQIYVSGGMTDRDLEALDEAFEEIEAVAGSSGAPATLSTGSKTIEGYLTGATLDLPRMSGFELSAGRFFTESDQRRAARVLVLGRGMVRDLFGDEDASALGKVVRVGTSGERYTVVGILEGSGTSMAYTQALVPARTMMQRLTGAGYYDQCYAQAAEGADVVELSGRVRDHLLSAFKLTEDEVFVYSMQEIMAQLEIVMAGFSLMLTAIASISLFVGGIGIMNMMLTTVTERTREIGLRKSLGAHTGDITRQFLVESIALCLTGGLFGIIFGYLGALGLAGIVNLMQPDVAFLPAIGASAVLIAVGVCALIGIVFGLYPARRAARMDPVESLRYQ
jgi:putative ABC transport system permease protein